MGEGVLQTNPPSVQRATVVFSTQAGMLVWIRRGADLRMDRIVNIPAHVFYDTTKSSGPSAFLGGWIVRADGPILEPFGTAATIKIS